MLPHRIFVFGSNLRGRHGKGAALDAARYYEAKEGVGVGRTGNAYAIPTKDEKLNVLPLQKIKPYVIEFILYAQKNPDLPFLLTRVGCGLARYTDADIAPMFRNCPPNVIMPSEWKKWYKENPCPTLDTP